MKYKNLIFEYIACRVIIKRFKNLISCCANNLRMIRFNKKFSFLIFKEFGLDNLVM